MVVAQNEPIIGENVFTQTAGVHADGDRKNELYYNSLLPERFGRKREYALGKLSGEASITENLLELGIKLGKKYVQKVTERIVQLGDKKEIVTQDDLPYIVADIVKRDSVINKVKIVNYSLTMSHGLHPTATVKLEIEGKEYEQSAFGDGQFDAFIKAVKKIYKDNLKRQHRRAGDDQHHLELQWPHHQNARSGGGPDRSRLPSHHQNAKHHRRNAQIEWR